jgi:hypothetical protein
VVLAVKWRFLLNPSADADGTDLRAMNYERSRTDEPLISARLTARYRRRF